MARTGEMIEVSLAHLDATRALAARLAPLLGPGDVITLWGPLGAGKSTFARYLITALSALCGRDPGEVPSPTFTLAQLYETARAPVWHFDLYRLERPEDTLELGMEEAFASAISVIEWPDRLGPWLPRERLDVTLAIVSGDARRAEISGHGARGRALEGALAPRAA